VKGVVQVKKLTVALKNCYGIHEFNHTFSFKKNRDQFLFMPRMEP